ncbi:hypothetical protein OG735_35530 [Streptomyces sp. NBC_01210]|uniref:hypothetical protein n=1 Tax=Streptomyces sp. NBC_01210 TaxID=2903774 RepID=UPI002E15C3E6|nr:hypothetical protein OG735_35530 [Streptomyces sp. NBC_01210]
MGASSSAAARASSGTPRLAASSDPQGLAADERVRVREPRADPLGVPAPSGRDDGEPALVGTARIELGQQRPQLRTTHLPGPHDKFTHAEPIREWVERVQEAVPVAPAGVGHAEFCLLRSGEPY